MLTCPESSPMCWRASWGLGETEWDTCCSSCRWTKTSWGNILAADIEIDPDELRKARVRCVKEVKETNGEISFEDTVRYQKGAE